MQEPGQLTTEIENTYSLDATDQVDLTTTQ
jgi:hypothetical protein